MQTHLSDIAKQLPRGEEAESILRACVHCGFCTATCPTYQVLGDELDGPRGRIYLIKQVLEGEPVTASTQLHLDRCLSCRNCETTCPSGVRYHDLLDIGRAVVARQVQRPLGQRLLRNGLRTVLAHPRAFKALAHTGRVLHAWLPGRLKDTLAATQSDPGQRPAPRHPRRILMLEGCVQQALSPNTNAAAARLLDRLGISVEPIREAGCCGALDYHLDAQEQGLQRARLNIDAWWPAIEAGAEAIVQTASGCGAFVRDYAHLLERDPLYAAKAARVSALARDLVQVLQAEPLERLGLCAEQRLAFHCPCTLQHALKLAGAVEHLLTRLGFHLTDVPDGHLCCGSAGTYSLTQPELSRTLRDNRLSALESGHPELIATANIGCQLHLDGAGRTPVRHWIEIVEAALDSQPTHA
ncbi:MULTISPECIES: glycolate oxidase subunit GlcF [Pseudomonas]|uniref:Glycolate oxidase iron-sulfur subunit n=1 Tax=Pseudomonas mosselii TaxID=78327 RepID=A0A5R8ZGG1_9PSED|nr:glycolate oxidase subunit GlcF [Pseudomonas mosselii]TLP64850.1 glycolate oxidase subunit GlcF [Pseudomonas mosselii]